MENMGEPLPFEVSYWAGERSADAALCQDEDEQPYALPFHPPDMGEDALRALCGFIQEGMPEPEDVEADRIELHGFRMRDPAAADHRAAMDERRRKDVAARNPSRHYRMDADGRPVEYG